MARGVSAKYPTSGSRVIVDDMLDESGHTALLGASTRKAHEDIDMKAKRSYKDVKSRLVGKSGKK